MGLATTKREERVTAPMAFALQCVKGPNSPYKIRVKCRADRKSQVRQCLSFCTADFWPALAYESAEQKPKHCLT